MTLRDNGYMYHSSSNQRVFTRMEDDIDADADSVPEPLPYWPHWISFECSIILYPTDRNGSC